MPRRWAYNTSSSWKTLHAFMDFHDARSPDKMPETFPKLLRRRSVVRRSTTALFVVFTLAIPNFALAQKVNFAGKTVTIISSFGPGGGYSIYADLLARHLGKHLPGSPAVLVKYMPGAGGISGTNYLYNVAPRDAT